MRKIILTTLILGSSISTAQSVSSLSFKERLGAEAGFIYLKQDGGGNTTTVFPFLDLKVWGVDEFSLNAQVGATAYKDEATSKTFAIAALRVNPIYQISAMFSVEGLLGVQAWESKGGAKTDFGARMNYRVNAISDNWINDVYLGAGTIAHDDPTIYMTLGLKKWF